MRKTLAMALLLTALTSPRIMAQAGFKASTKEYRAGQVLWKRPAHIEYAIENTGDQPLVLSYVEPECDCSVAEWTRTPIAPGQSGLISVTFDASLLGYFSKSIAVHNNSPESLVYLWFDGHVVERLTDYSQSHPFVFGDLRCDVSEIQFDDVTREGTATAQLSLVNTSDHPLEPVLMHVPSYLDVRITPSIIGEGERADVTLVLRGQKAAMYGLNRTQVYVSRFMGDKVGKENEIPVSFLLLPVLEAPSSRSPRLEISGQMDISSRLRKKGQATASLTLANRGESDLQILSVQTQTTGLKVNVSNSVRPGKKVSLRVTAQAGLLKEETDVARILLITNDPVQPKVTLEIRLK